MSAGLPNAVLFLVEKQTRLKDGSGELQLKVFWGPGIRIPQSHNKESVWLSSAVPTGVTVA